MTTCIIMPTVPRRAASAADVVRRLLPQTDSMIIHLNGHAGVPAWARDKRIRAIVHPAGTGPLIRLSVVPTSDHVLLIDDDLAYPPDYVKKSVATLTRLGPQHAICYHAARWPKGTKPVFSIRQIVMYSAGIEKDLPVTYMGSGTAGFHRTTFAAIDRNAPKLFEYEDDVWVSSACARKSVKMVRASSPANWISPLPAAYDAGALYRGASSNAFVNRNKAMQAALALGGWSLSL